MNLGDLEQREDLLARLMADYDEALALDAPTVKIDATAAELDPQLAAEWENAKHCLELLEQARRSGDLAPILWRSRFEHIVSHYESTTTRAIRARTRVRSRWIGHRLSGS